MRRHRGTSPGAPLFAALALSWPFLAADPAEARLIRPAAAVADKAGFPFAVHDELLHRYVDADGRVDYERLRAEAGPQVERLYAAIAARPRDHNGPVLRRGPVRSEALAFYLDAYNLLVWKGVLLRLSGSRAQPDGQAAVRSLAEDRLSFFQFTRYLVAGEPFGLEELAHRRLRLWFADPRVHFALSCGAVGCPRLQREAFVPERVDAQLDAQARRFIAEPRNVDYDAGARVLRLSPLFSWYHEDFGASDADLIAYLNRFRPPGQQLPAGVRIEYAGFDWQLNEQPGHPAPSPGSGTSSPPLPTR